MVDKPASNPATFIGLSMALVLTLFTVSIGYTGRPGFFVFFAAISGGHPVPAELYLLVLANLALWTGLFALGWSWYGRAALWLLLVAPFAFYPVPFLLLLISLGRV
jgi:hypothetical protein